MKSLFAFTFVLAVGAALFRGTSDAAESLTDRVKGLEPIIGGHPPNIKSEHEFNAIKKRYVDIKAELDSLLVKKPDDQQLLFLRGHLQSMGHNFDYPGAWQGSTDDLRALLKENPRHVPAMIELATLWVNSNPKLAPNAENLFRGAQCYHGDEPLETAQRGVFFALYYQGKMKEALRQSEYLTKAWPQNEEYRKLNEMTRSVVARTKKDTDAKEPIADKLVMASCNN
jgi:hypothetical protein